jgi:hypothetical protein
MRSALAFCFAAVLGYGGDWNKRLAADYLDGRQQTWFAWKPAAAKGGPCMSCHTGLTYLLARPALRKALKEPAPTEYETGLLAGLRARLEQNEPKSDRPNAEQAALYGSCGTSPRFPL